MGRKGLPGQEDSARRLHAEGLATESVDLTMITDVVYLIQTLATCVQYCTSWMVHHKLRVHSPCLSKNRTHGLVHTTWWQAFHEDSVTQELAAASGRDTQTHVYVLTASIRTATVVTDVRKHLALVLHGAAYTVASSTASVMGNRTCAL